MASITYCGNMASKLDKYSDAEFSELLRRYLLNNQEMSLLGFPMECSDLSGDVVINHQEPENRVHHHRLNNGRKPETCNFNANAREFVPTSRVRIDSGRISSCSSSLESSDLEQESSSIVNVNAREFMPTSSLRIVSERVSSRSSSLASSDLEQESSGFFNVNAQEFVPAARARIDSERINSSSSSLESSDFEQESSGIFNVNAREFVPTARTRVDSGRGSCSNSSLESSDLEQESSSDSNKSSDIVNAAMYRLSEKVTERRCVRCSKTFYVSDKNGKCIVEDKCCYHWGKFISGRWECCGCESSSGCTSADTHVWRGILAGCNRFQDFTRTEPAMYHPIDKNYGVYALDCEMCFTTRGLDVGRVTLIDLNGYVVYEAMVKPDAEVIDYNTRFSGLSAQDFIRAKSLREVQQELKSFIFAETILIGHGLENDLRALKLLHPTVIDTTFWYPHYRGFPYRNSLKSLAKKFLGKDIQQHEHDSAEDARIALDLMHLKVCDEL